MGTQLDQAKLKAMAAELAKDIKSGPSTPLRRPLVPPRPSPRGSTGVAGSAFQGELVIGREYLVSTTPTSATSISPGHSHSEKPTIYLCDHPYQKHEYHCGDIRIHRKGYHDLYFPGERFNVYSLTGMREFSPHKL